MFCKVCNDAPRTEPRGVDYTYNDYTHSINFPWVLTISASLWVKLNVIMLVISHVPPSHISQFPYNANVYVAKMLLTIIHWLWTPGWLQISLHNQCWDGVRISYQRNITDNVQDTTDSYIGSSPSFIHLLFLQYICSRETKGRKWLGVPHIYMLAYLLPISTKVFYSSAQILFYVSNML